MKSIFKFCIAAVLMFSVVLTGCSAGKKAEKERDKIVAEVNGEKILKGEVLDQYDSQKEYYGINAQNENTDEYKEVALNLKSSILENLIYTRLMTQNAKTAGYTVTDEVLEQAKAEFNEIIKDVEEQIKAQEGEDTSGNTDYTKKAQEFIDGQLKAMGKTQDEYIKMMAEQTVNQQFMDKTIGEISISDEDIKSFYDNELKAQKEGNATQQIELYTLAGVRVKHILIPLPKEEQDEFSNLFNQQKTEEAKSYLEEKLKGIYPKAQEVLAKVKKGENFEKLIEEYGEDPGMVGNDEGYVVRKNGEYTAEFESASLKLKAGQTSELVSTGYGYHIIKAYEIVKEKIFTLEEKKAEIKDIISTQKKDEKYQAILDEWLKKATVNKYEDQL